VLVPLPKRRGGSDAARVIVGLMYADTASAWGPSGEWRLTLPALDLPVQQMGLTVKHSPRYRLTPLPSDFHAQAVEPPLSEVLQLENERTDAKDAALAAGEAFAHERKVKQDAASADQLREGDHPAPESPAPPPAVGPLAQRAEVGPRRRGQDEEGQALGGLVERFQREARGVRSVGTLPVLVAFPESGPGIYLAAALTADGAAPTAAFTFKRAVK
jgi:hypothetical protein